VAKSPNARLRAEIDKLKRRLRMGDRVLTGNIAVAYRVLGNRRRAFEWWWRAAGPDDGDSFVEVGYCLQYGIGVRRNPAAAMKAYRVPCDLGSLLSTGGRRPPTIWQWPASTRAPRATGNALRRC
jgi:hypothetical protein